MPNHILENAPIRTFRGLAVGSSDGAGRVRRHGALAPGGEVWLDIADASGRLVGANEHRRGCRAPGLPGVGALSEYCARLVGGAQLPAPIRSRPWHLLVGRLATSGRYSESNRGAGLRPLSPSPRARPAKFLTVRSCPLSPTPEIVQVPERPLPVFLSRIAIHRFARSPLRPFAPSPVRPFARSPAHPSTVRLFALSPYRPINLPPHPSELRPCPPPAAPTASGNPSSAA
jgi:hypothetical protein